MTEQCVPEISAKIKNLDIKHSTENLSDSNLETAEEASTPDSTNNYVKGSYRCEKFDYTESSNNSNMTITPRSIHGSERDSHSLNVENIYNNIQIPIVGYEVMEERARFTVYKLRVENKSSGDCWYVFRRYTDFVRLCNKLKHSYPSLSLLMPRKKWFGNNFDPSFLEERIHGLQVFVNAIISIPELVSSQQIQDFFCLNEPPAYSDTTEESRAIFEALEDTIYHLRHQLKEKETSIEHLHSRINDMSLNHQNLNRFIKTSTENCQKCNKDYENYKKTVSCSNISLKTASKDYPGSFQDIPLSCSSSSSLK